MESENTTNESEIIAKTTNTKQGGPMMGEIDGTNSDSSAGDGAEMNGVPEMPSDLEGEMQGGMGGFRGEMMTAIPSSNVWLVPMTATGIISGSIILAAVAICIMLFRVEKKLPKN